MKIKFFGIIILILLCGCQTNINEYVKIKNTHIKEVLIDGEYKSEITLELINTNKLNDLNCEIDVNNQNYNIGIVEKNTITTTKITTDISNGYRTQHISIMCKLLNN